MILALMTTTALAAPLRGSSTCSDKEACITRVKTNRAVFERVGTVKGVSRPAILELNVALGPTIAIMAEQCNVVRYFANKKRGYRNNYGMDQRLADCEAWLRQLLDLVHLDPKLPLAERAKQLVEGKDGDDLECPGERGRRSIRAFGMFAKMGLKLAARGGGRMTRLAAAKQVVKKLAPRVMMAATAAEAVNFMLDARWQKTDGRGDTGVYDLDNVLRVVRQGQMIRQKAQPLLDLLKALPNRRLSAGAVDRAILNDEFLALKESARRDHIELSASDALDLFDFETAHQFIYCNLSVDVQVVVPGELEKTKGEVLRYVPTPLEVGDGLSLTPVPDEPILLVDEDGAIMEALSESEFSDCRADEDGYDCRRTRHQNTAATATCVGGLYRGVAAGLGAFCRFKGSDHDKDQLVQISDTRFLAYHSEARDLRVECPGATALEETTTGMAEIEVPPDCQVTSAGETRWSTDGLPGAHRSAKVVVIGLLQDAMQTVAEHFVDPAVKDSLARSAVGIDKSTASRIMAEAATSEWMNNALWSLAGTAGGASGLGAALAAIVYRLRAQHETSEDEEETEEEEGERVEATPAPAHRFSPRQLSAIVQAAWDAREEPEQPEA